MKRKDTVGNQIIPLLFIPFLIIQIIPFFDIKNALRFFFPAVVVLIVLIPVLFSNRSSGFKIIIFSVMLSAFLTVICLSSLVKSEQKLCLKTENIMAVCGKVIYDSSYTSTGKTMITMRLLEVEDISGNSTSSEGILTVISNESVLISTGSVVRCEGVFTDNNIFIADLLVVTDKNIVNYIREKIINIFTKRIIGSKEDSFRDYRLLSLMLLTGRAESNDIRIKEMAENCGCLHVLALSGMHLNFICLIIKSIFRKEKISRLVSFPFVFLFVFVAGPRPSLLRALIMFCLSSSDKHLRLVLTYLIQAVIVSYTILNIGSIYGYVCVTALVIYAPYLSALLGCFMPKSVSSVIGASVSVLVFNAPVQIITSGCWYPVSIICGPVVTVFAALSMFGGFSGLVMGINPVSEFMQKQSYHWMKTIFEFSSGFPKAGVRGYVVFLISVFLTVMLLSGIRILIRKRAERRLSGIRFPETKAVQDDLLPVPKYEGF